MNFQKLKLGILLDSFEVPAWIYSVVKKLANGDSAELALVILDGGAEKKQTLKWNTVVYSVFNRVDEKLFTKSPDPLAPRSVAGLLVDVPVIQVTPVRAADTSTLTDADIEKIKQYQLDVLIKFGFETLDCRTLCVSKYGTWFYYHGDVEDTRGGPPGFWEAVENSPTTGSALLAVGGDLPASRVLYRSHFFTYPLSPARHRSYFFWAAASFLPRQIDLLHCFGEEMFWRSTERFNRSQLCDAKKIDLPSNGQAIPPIAKLSARLLKEYVQRYFWSGQWSLRYSLQKNIQDGFSAFDKLIPPKGLFWADPHSLHVDGKYLIFLEEFSFAKNKGHISVIEMDETGRAKPPVKILDKDYHLSYPFVFEWEKKFYMVPESRGNRTIDLYEAVEFPYRWEFKRSLMDNVSAVDTTLVHYSNKWWLFTAMAENEAAAPNVELFLFYADDLFGGEWKAHPLNPIVSDVRSARPAGGIFLQDGKLFRPSQDCSRMYGYGFDLNEIETLSETDYCERKITSVRPTWDKRILATHTYSHQGNLTVIDTFAYTRK